MVFDLARAIPYDHELQERLLQFLHELTKLPARKAKIWNEECHVYEKDPILPSVLDDNWNGSFPSHPYDPEDPSSRKSLEEWVNFSTFLARCIKSGLLDRFDGWGRYPAVEIRKALEENPGQGPRRDCLVMVAAQYFQVAGNKIHHQFVAQYAIGSQERQRGLEAWGLWSGRLQVLADGQGLKPEVEHAVKEARTLMLSLEPSIAAEPRDTVGKEEVDE
ncbi:hypothetical protein PG995_012223 [Apiospora arundinis]